MTCCCLHPGPRGYRQICLHSAFRVHTTRQSHSVCPQRGCASHVTPIFTLRRNEEVPDARQQVPEKTHIPHPVLVTKANGCFWRVAFLTIGGLKKNKVLASYIGVSFRLFWSINDHPLPTSDWRLSECKPRRIPETTLVEFGWRRTLSSVMTLLGDGSFILYLSIWRLKEIK